MQCELLYEETTIRKSYSIFSNGRDRAVNDFVAFYEFALHDPSNAEEVSK